MLAISLALMFERLSDVKTLPFEVKSIGGFLPPECLIWTLILVEMGVRDIVQIWTQAPEREQ